MSVEEYIEFRVEHDPNLNVTALRRDIHEAIRAKLEGYRCRQCKGELWPVRTVIADDNLCFDCFGLEPNSENDIEFDIVLEKVY